MFHNHVAQLAILFTTAVITIGITIIIITITTTTTNTVLLLGII